MPDKRFFKKLELVTEQIITSYNNGMTLEEVAELHQCTAGTVRNLLIANSVARRKQGRKKEIKLANG